MKCDSKMNRHRRQPASRRRCFFKNPTCICIHSDDDIECLLPFRAVPYVSSRVRVSLRIVLKRDGRNFHVRCALILTVSSPSAPHPAFRVLDDLEQVGPHLTYGTARVEEGEAVDMERLGALHARVDRRFGTTVR